MLQRLGNVRKEWGKFLSCVLLHCGGVMVRIIVGLGNPGKRYVQTRHNAGFWVVDQLSQRWNIRPNSRKFQAIVAEGHYLGEKIILAKPQTFMNLSGESVRKIVNYWNIDSENLLVIFDDFALPKGQIRLRSKGSSGGHKGVTSIIDMLGTDTFARLKIGIGPIPEHISAPDYVLTELKQTEIETYQEIISRSADAVEVWVNSGIDQAMNLYNYKKNEE